MPQRSTPQTSRNEATTRASGVEVEQSATDEAEEAEASDGEHEPTLEEMRAAYMAQMRGQREPVLSARSAKPAHQDAFKPKSADPYEADDLVTLLLPNVIRGVVEGVDTKDGRVFYPKTRRDFIGTEQPGEMNEETGRRERSLAVTLTFTGGACRSVQYAVAKGLKKARPYRSNDAMKVVPDDTPETTYAKLCGVQPMQPQKQAALLLASDLDAVLAEFTTEQLATFSQALARRVRAGTGGDVSSPSSNGILSSQSFSRG